MKYVKIYGLNMTLSITEICRQNHLNYYPKICICTIYMNISNSHSLYFRLCPLPFYSSFTRLLRKIDDWHSFNTYLFNRQVTKEHILVVTANQQKMNDVYRQLFYFLILKVLSKGRYKKYCMRQYFFENMDMDSTWSQQKMISPYDHFLFAMVKVP